MCGIFGVVADANKYKKTKLLQILENIAISSEVRGQDSSGIAFHNNNCKSINVLRSPISISKLLKSKAYQNFKKIISTSNCSSFSIIGHARLVTNGTQLNHDNNQPVVKDGIVGVHNGIIVNDLELWKKHNDLNREFKIDTEILFSLIKKYLKNTKSYKKSIKSIKNELKGTASIGCLFNDTNQLLLYSNNGSIYILTNDDDFLVFASEKFMLEKLQGNFESFFKSNFFISQITPNTGYLIDTKKINITKLFSRNSKYLENNSLKKIKVSNLDTDSNQLDAVLENNINFSTNIYNEKHLEYNINEILDIKRCSKCILPATFPFIEFDKYGVCNYCLRYVKRNEPKPIEKLLNIVAPYRKPKNEIDCLVPFSGGRDSTYVLHYVKNILKLNPIAYTYDWGMVTDLARRNIARVCGQLGVENIIVAADIRKKRRNIKKNIIAWLKRPSLGMIPLFMAGDKYFFKYANQIKKQNNIDLQIWGINFLENTDFKVGFAGVPPEWEKDMIYSMNSFRQIKLFKYVLKNLILNPSYINSSIPDTMGSFISRYLNPRKDYYHFFDFHQWNESDIDDVIINQYEWETASDIDSTWRIGDGTASFYNYIYYTVAGFSEFDTFRSNQIREGMILRSDALKEIKTENRPRLESLIWYLKIIGLDFSSTLKKINNIPKLYR